MEGRDPWLWLLAEPAGASTCASKHSYWLPRSKARATTQLPENSSQEG